MQDGCPETLLTGALWAGGVGSMAGWGAFVGRERDLSRLASALSGGRLVLVAGDAGIGKTRFVGEGFRRARASGMVAVSGGCLPLAEKLPLLPVADALGELTRLEGGAPFEAAVAAAPSFVRSEVARLLPRLAAGERPAIEPVEGWRYERLFASVAELLSGVARQSQLGLLIEDVHWADTATLDFLTYLVRAVRGAEVRVVVTCRSDEVPLDAGVADWLTHVRRDAGVEEIRLGPLSRAEVAEQITGLVGATPPAALVREVCARAEGHPFFTEQLVTAALSDLGQREQPVALPARLAELLVGRAARCGADAQAVLNGLAVAGRPLSEDMLGEVSGLDPRTVLAAVRELTAARLLAVPGDRGHLPRHVLLAEAVAAELLPSERVSLHQRVARALETAGGETLAAEAAGHWAAAGRSAEELQARLTAARCAEQVFVYADAAAHWQRAIELCQADSAGATAVAIDLPHLYMRAVDALEASGDWVQAGVVAEDAYRRFADHPDPAIAAVIHQRAACLRAMDSPAAGLPLIRAALRLFAGTSPSAEQAKAWYRYANDFLLHAEGRLPAEILAAFNRALDVARAAGAATQIPRILCLIAYQSFLGGEVEDGFRLLAQARSEPGASQDGLTVLHLAATESDALLKVGKLEEAIHVASLGTDAGRKLGFENNFYITVVLANAVDGLVGQGRTKDAAALIDPQTVGPVDKDRWLLHICRAEIDLLRGDADAAARRLYPIKLGVSLDIDRELGQRLAEVALWARRPDEALEEVRRILERLDGTCWVILCGWLLAVGMRACADLAERARARRDEPTVERALAAADDLASWVDRARGVPFSEHPFVAMIPAAHATWTAERSRAAGASSAEAWGAAADQWEALGYRHRVAYTRWRQAEALLAASHGGREAAATVLSTAAGLALEHVPLATAIDDLAHRARIDLRTSTQPVQFDKPAASHPFGLTGRELAVLQLLGQGKTNPEIAAALFISPRTAGVHVTHILRKLDATSRVQAATIAERAGVLNVNPSLFGSRPSQSQRTLRPIKRH
jgi:DNA-binding CsgD family transcriptional regulator/tetratricopeptide (TPR) repeat protein